ncbi:hypothetical protein ACOME3_004034 [Neoechinorhynchus agilis]
MITELQFLELGVQLANKLSICGYSNCFDNADELLAQIRKDNRFNAAEVRRMERYVSASCQLKPIIWSDDKEMDFTSIVGCRLYKNVIYLRGMINNKLSICLKLLEQAGFNGKLDLIKCCQCLQVSTNNSIGNVYEVVNLVQLNAYLHQIFENINSKVIIVLRMVMPFNP